MTADHDRMEDIVAACVLDACDEEERRLVAAHLVGCASCQALARRLKQAADVLPLSVEQVRPPDRLRARILAAAAAGQAPPPAPERPTARIVPLPVRPEASGRVHRRRFRLPLQWAAVAVLALSLLALGAWNLVLNQMLSAPPARYAVVGTGSLAGASGTVTASRRQDVALLSLTGMPQPPEGKVYELWLIDAAGKATSGGVFTPSADGTANVGIDRPLRDVKTVAVTAESGPAGTRAPTQKPELAGQIG